jgi:hypothetical protein
MSSEQQEPIEAPTAGAVALISKIRFEDCDYTVEQTKRILAVGATKFFKEVLPELENYLQGTRRIITGRSIKAYRERKLAEAPQKSAVGSRGSKQLHESRNEKRRNRKSGSAP